MVIDHPYADKEELCQKKVPLRLMLSCLQYGLNLFLLKWVSRVRVFRRVPVPDSYRIGHLEFNCGPSGKGGQCPPDIAD